MDKLDNETHVMINTTTINKKQIGIHLDSKRFSSSSSVSNINLTSCRAW